MTRLCQRSRAALKTCAYGFAALSVLGTGIAATMSFSSEAPSGKIGPGYARMQPINVGKPDKVVSIPPYSIPVLARAAVKRAPTKSIESLIEEAAPPLKVAVDRRMYVHLDLHRIY